MKAGSRLQMQLVLQNSAFAALLVVAAGLILWLLRDNSLQWDLTRGQRNTLSRATTDVLKKMDSPIGVTAYASNQASLRQVIHAFIEPYHRAQPKLALSYVDPREHPKETQAANVRVDGELVIEYGKRTEHLTELNEQNMANVLQRLARAQERLVVYLDGHGEPKLDGQANFDLGEFGRQLENKGFHIQPLNLARVQDVPQNASVLVIATPRAELLKGEVEKLKRYVEGGGNLLWFIDQEPLRGLQPLAEYLGLQLGAGIVVDPAVVPPTIAQAASYGVHAITKNFAYNTVFPFARQIEVRPENGPWRTTRLVEAAARGWLKTDYTEKNIRFDKDRDIPGPITVAVALERKVKDKDQRVVVVGSGAFLSNQYLGTLFNLDLGTNMLNWLAEDENLITVQPRPRVDSQLNLGTASRVLIFFGYLVALPAAFLLAGTLVWWRRRKA
jgi:ABC-type uncharacterized transport system involved in gliding motility auxiliary subunit